jgi:pantoate--beta-alanine ligase
MQVARSIQAKRRVVGRGKKESRRIGLVPTMGYLHAGHLSLVKRAHRAAGKGGKVVVSIYVNPTQFGPSEDFSRYPRDLKRDFELCRAAGVDAVFVPNDREMYRRRESQSFSTYVIEERLSRTMEGKARTTHFRGVTTVVAKLFNIVQPDVAVFGAKDYQQAVIIKRMVADLNFPLRIEVGPIVREPDGLAMSSRNKYLEGDLRWQATVLSRAVASAREKVRASGKPVNAGRLRTELQRLIRQQPAARVDYIEFFEPTTLVPAEKVRPGTHVALAVFIGKTRLIDNGRI